MQRPPDVVQVIVFFAGKKLIVSVDAQNAQTILHEQKVYVQIQNANGMLAFSQGVVDIVP